MGFGRSGTSLMGGILHQTGYYMGDNLYPPRDSNPKGFFENNFINGINEQILSQYDLIKGHHYCLNYSPFKPNYGHRWLSYITPSTNIVLDNFEIICEIKKALSYPNFAYKDPRFNYTFPIWDQISEKKLKYICIYRDPGAVINSVIKECETAEKLAFELWNNNYINILNKLNDSLLSRFLFINYNQFYQKKNYEKISNFLGGKISSNFFSKNLNRSKKQKFIPAETKKIYSELNKLSGYNNGILSLLST